MQSHDSIMGEAETVSPNEAAYGLSYAVTSLLSSLLVVLKESNEATHDLLNAITGYHWVTHSLAVIISFIVLGFVFKKIGSGVRLSVNILVSTIVGATIVSSLIIIGYFI